MQICGDRTMLNNKNLKLMMAKHIEKDINRENLTWKEKISDEVVHFLGTWLFFMIVNGIIIGYCVLQSFIPFDRQLLYLNFGLSYFAAIGQNFILMSEGRSSARNRRHMEVDLNVNVQTKKLLEEMDKKLDRQQKQIDYLVEENERLHNKENKLEGDICENKS